MRLRGRTAAIARRLVSSLPANLTSMFYRAGQCLSAMEIYYVNVETSKSLRESEQVCNYLELSESTWRAVLTYISWIREIIIEDMNY